MNRSLARQAGFFSALALFLLLFSCPVPADTLIDCTDTIQPGQPFIITITSDRELSDVVIRWRGKDLPLPVQRTADGPFQPVLSQGTLILGMPLDGTEKTMPLRVSYKEKGTPLSHSYNLKVVPKDYPVQELSVDSKSVDLSQADADRAARDRQRNAEVTARYTPVQMWTLPFNRPVPGSLSSLFGLRRVFNGQPRNSHRGLDFRGAEGTPIHAVADGVVALAEDQFFSGRVVYVDHGLGVFSVYMHMSKFSVQEGDRVERGQELGLIGSTGRVTGPHLHLSLMLQGSGADPLPLLEEQEAQNQPAP